MLRPMFPDEVDRINEGTPGKYMYKDPGVYTLKNDKSIEELGITCELRTVEISRGSPDWS